MAVLLGLLTPATAHAAVSLPGVPVETCVMRARAGLTPAVLFAAPDRFDCRTPQRAYHAGDYFVLSRPLTRLDGAAERLRFASLWQQRTTLHALYADGAIVSLGAADSRALSRRVQLGAIVEFAIPVRAAPVTRLLWHVEGAANLRGIVLGGRVATARQSATANLVMATLYAGFGGLCLALLIHNLALWGALRHRFQLAYCGLLATLLVYAVSSSGALAWWVPGLANNDRLRINYVGLALSGTMALAFARSFFEPRVFAGWLGRLAGIVSALPVAAACAFAALAPAAIRPLDRFYALAFVALLALVVPVLWRAWRLRSNYLWVFAITWGAPIVFATLRTAQTFGLVDWSFWLDNSTLLAMLLEAIVSSLAIAYRIRLLSRERDEAREQESAARALADIDPLTGLSNRRAFLRDAIGRAGAQMLLIVDVDHFKRVNETLGHDGGDEVLRLVARALRAATPAGAIVARLGGEEFAILDVAGRGLSADAVLARVRSERMPLDLAVTVSIGCGIGPLATDADWKQLYRRADGALFEAKAAGRDRARHAAVATLAA